MVPWPAFPFIDWPTSRSSVGRSPWSLIRRRPCRESMVEAAAAQRERSATGLRVFSPAPKREALSMAIFGIGAMYGGDTDVAPKFIKKKLACVGWDEDTAQPLHAILKH